MNFKKLERCEVSKNSQARIFCGPAVLKRFDIGFPNRATSGIEMKKVLESCGYTVESNYTWSIGNGDAGSRGFWPTLSRVIREVYGDLPLESMDIIFFTNNHVLCIKDGVVTDTERNRAGRRHCTLYYVVKRKQGWLFRLLGGRDDGK